MPLFSVTADEGQPLRRSGMGAQAGSGRLGGGGGMWEACAKRCTAAGPRSTAAAGLLSLPSATGRVAAAPTALSQPALWRTCTLPSFSSRQHRCLHPTSGTQCRRRPPAAQQHQRDAWHGTLSASRGAAPPHGTALAAAPRAHALHCSAPTQEPGRSGGSLPALLCQCPGACSSIRQQGRGRGSAPAPRAGSASPAAPSPWPPPAVEREMRVGNRRAVRHIGVFQQLIDHGHHLRQWVG